MVMKNPDKLIVWLQCLEMIEMIKDAKHSTRVNMEDAESVLFYSFKHIQERFTHRGLVIRKYMPRNFVVLRYLYQR